MATPKQAAESGPVRLLGRVGLVTYGVVHLLIAYLAFRVAIGDGGKADKTGALQTLAASTGGVWVLWLTAAGLAALVVWQLSEALLGHRGLRGGPLTVRRAVDVGEAVLCAYLAYTAGRIAASGKGPSDTTQSGIVARLLAQPWGKAVVVLLGLLVVAGAALLAHRGLTGAFTRSLDFRGASAATRRRVTRLGRVGYPAIGAVYATAGVLVVVAALRADPSKATGLDTSLKTLASQSYGPALLLVLAAGLVAYGVFALAEARFRRD